MTLIATKICKDTLHCMRRCSAPIFFTHLIYSVLGVVLFGPLVGVLGQLLLHFSGQPALADQDIANFLISPLGMLSLASVSTIVISILALEQASLIIISAGTKSGNGQRGAGRTRGSQFCRAPAGTHGCTVWPPSSITRVS